MRSVDDVVGRQPELFAQAAPFAPWDYIRLRREAAGLTIGQAARPFWHRDEHRAGVEANLRTFEMPGVRVKRIVDVDLPRAFAFDPEIYRQLAELPADLHPRLCRGCGWDRWTSQFDLDGNDCAWSTERPELCSRCEQIDARGARRAA